MQFLNKSAPLGVLLAVLFLAACQTTSTTPVTAEQVPTLISGIWDGHFINRQGIRFPVMFNLKGRNGKITDKAHVPDSSYDENPTLSGTYSGNTAIIKTSSDFTIPLPCRLPKMATIGLRAKQQDRIQAVLSLSVNRYGHEKIKTVRPVGILPAGRHRPCRLQ